MPNPSSHNVGVAGWRHSVNSGFTRRCCARAPQRIACNAYSRMCSNVGTCSLMSSNRPCAKLFARPRAMNITRTAFCTSPPPHMAEQ
eukprot:13248705-Alexandrium_andersonii.AAC.1